MSGHVPNNEFHEWSYMQDELGILYCLGRGVGPDRHEVVAAYYQTSSEHSTKQSLDDDTEYRRFVYQGLPEERARLSTVERPEVVDRLLAYTALTETGIYLSTSTLKPSQPQYRELATWLSIENPRAHAFQSALQIACMALTKAEVTLDELSLYGAASFGLVATTNKIVDDVDVVFSAANLPELRKAVDTLQSSFTWAEIDPYDRLLESRQKLKAKRWATSQIRLEEPYPMSIDLKVGREPGAPSLWDNLAVDAEGQQYSGTLEVVEDVEGFCTSPALRCEDRSGQEQILLLEGYQYIGCAVAGDIIAVRGTTNADSSVILVTQSDRDTVQPDFRNVPVF